MCGKKKMGNGLFSMKEQKNKQKVITTNECEKCIYGELVDDKMAKIMVHCKAKHKNYVYGQKIICNDRKESELNEYGSKV